MRLPRQFSDISKRAVTQLPFLAELHLDERKKAFFAWTGLLLAMAAWALQPAQAAIVVWGNSHTQWDRDASWNGNAHTFSGDIFLDYRWSRLPALAQSAPHLSTKILLLSPMILEFQMGPDLSGPPDLLGKFQKLRCAQMDVEPDGQFNPRPHFV